MLIVVVDVFVVVVVVVGVDDDDPTIVDDPDFDEAFLPNILSIEKFKADDLSVAVLDCVDECDVSETIQKKTKFYNQNIN